MPIITDIQLPDFHPFMRMDIPGLLRRVAATHAERQFMRWEPFEGNPRRWTYAQAYSDIRRMASGLAARGVSVGDAVILHLDNSPESILAWFACAELGAVAVTTNTRSAGEELAYFVEKSGAVGAITQPIYAEMVRQCMPVSHWLAVAEPGDDSLLGGDEIQVRELGPAHPLSIQFTSGTTARPKAVLWTHANGLWGAMVSARRLQLRPDDIALVINPLFHTVAMVWQVLASLWVGASLVVQPKFSASRFWTVAEDNACSWTTLGFFAAKALAGRPVAKNHRFRFNLLGVSYASSEMFFGIKCIGAHGMTELITQSVMNDPLSVLDENSMGRPTPEYDIRVQREDGSAATYGERGELQVKGVRGLSLFAEYLGDPVATAAAFTEDGFFKTGDIVTLREDGALVFSDRDKDMLKVGGENVAASEIEAVIRILPGVREVAVVAQPHNMLIQVPFAFVIPTEDAPADIETQISTACQHQLADFKRPRGICQMAEFPRSLGGKVAKAELRALLVGDNVINGEVTGGERVTDETSGKGVLQ